MLDDRLLPPGGAPVQCTRCGHVFTAAPPVLPQPGNSTQVFGAVPSPTVPSRPATSSTQVFGAVQVPNRPASFTQVFGAVPPSSGASARPPSSTQVFGAVPPPATPSKAGSFTQVFGAVAPAPAASPPLSGAPLFGAPPSLPPALSPAPTATQTFGAVGIPTSRPNTTQVFGSVGAPGPGLVPRPTISVERITGSVSQPSGGPGPGSIGRVEGLSRGPELGSFDDASLFPEPSFKSESAAESRPMDLGVSLPPESFPAPPVREMSGPAPLSYPASTSSPDDDDDLDRMMRRQLRGRSRRLVGWLAVLSLAGAAYYGYRTFQQRKPTFPPAVVAEQENAFVLLRRDDAATRGQAEEHLRSLVSQNPTYADGRAAYLIALVLDFDDQRVVINHLAERSKAYATQIARYQSEQRPDDWQKRAEELRGLMQEVKKQMDPLVDTATQLDEQIIALARALPPPSFDDPRPPLMVLRARALLASVKGQADALEQVTHYGSSGAQDSWGSVMFAEYALNSRVPPDTAQRAFQMMDGLRNEDKAFIRPYVLAARIAAAQRHPDVSISLLEAALALNPTHELAQKLAEWERHPEEEVERGRRSAP